MRVVAKDFLGHEDALHFGKIIEGDRGIEVMGEMIMDVQRRDDPSFEKRRFHTAGLVEFVFRLQDHVLSDHAHADDGRQGGKIGDKPEHEKSEPEIVGPKDGHDRSAKGDGAQAIREMEIELSLVEEVARG